MSAVPSLDYDLGNEITLLRDELRAADLLKD